MVSVSNVVALVDLVASGNQEFMAGRLGDYRRTSCVQAR